MRTTSLLLILVLLLSPILKCAQEKKQTPQVVILIDNSKSLLNYPSFNKASLLTVLKEMEQRLTSKGYSVAMNDLGVATVSFNGLKFDGLKTNLFDALQNVLDQNYQDNLSDIVLITDGNYNDGNSPSYVSNSNFVKIHTVLVGDTSKPKDYRINLVDYNPILLHNEKNEILVNISAIGAKGDFLDIKLIDVESNNLLGSKRMQTNSNNYSQNVQFSLNNLPNGRYHLKTLIESSAVEINTQNNSYHFELEVIDKVKKICIYSSFPHPDISALKSALKTTKSYSFVYNDKSKDCSNADLVVLYQIPNKIDNGRDIIEICRQRGIPILYIFGTQSAYGLLNQVQNEFRVQVQSTQLLDILPIPNNEFFNYYLNESFSNQASQLPPLCNQMIRIEFLGESSTFLHSKLNTRSSNQVLVGFTNRNGQRIGLIAAENIWKWRLSNYQISKNSLFFDDFIHKIMDYLISTNDRRQLVTKVSKLSSDEKEQVKIISNIYNELYQPIKVPNVYCTIESKNGLKKTDELLYNGSSYSLQTSGLSSGNYVYQVVANANGKKLQSKGFFTIMKQSIEDQYLPANYEDMNQLANKFGGKNYMFNQCLDLVSDLEKQQLKSKLIRESKSTSAIDSILILGLILILLCAEWLLRKYLGLH